MNLKNKEKNENKKDDNEIKIVIGDDSDLEISDVGDYMNNLRPKKHSDRKNVVIPKTKKK